MPIYEYQCQDCGRTFERLRRISGRDDDAGNPVRCDCGSTKVDRILYSRVAMQGTACSPAAGGG